MKKTRMWYFASLLVFVFGCANTSVMKPGTYRSPHFKAVTDKLDMGGEVFLYLDIDGDAEKGAKFVDMVAKQFKDKLKSDSSIKLDAATIVKLLGFDQVAALGLSSYRDGKYYRNRAYIRHSGQNKGLMRLVANPPHAFEISRMAPSNADIAFEKEVRLKTLYDVTTEVLREIFGEQANQWLHMVHQPVPGLSVSYIQLLEKLDTRIVGVIRIDPEKTVNIPGAEFALPHIDILIGLDDQAILFDQLVKVLGAVPVFKHTEEEALSLIELNMPLPGGLGDYKPLLAKQKDNGRVFLATSRKLLDEYFADKPSLETTQAFQAATDGLPTEGNGISYMSPRLVSAVNKLFGDIGKAYPAAQEGIDLVSAFLPEPNLPIATVHANLKEGIYIASNNTSSHKGTFLALAYGSTAVIGGVIAAVVMPTYVEYQKKAESVEPKK